MRLLVTGGLGFIGSNYIRHVLETTDDEVVNLDLQTYAGNPENLADVDSNPRYTFMRGDVGHREIVDRAMAYADAVVHFAAESHVDRSIEDPTAFIRTNVLGTQVLLDSAREKKIDRFVFVSTDEVYGSVEQGFSKEGDPFLPNSPYAASKAGADLLARSYFQTFKMPVLITRCSNNFGPYQFPEKVIPVCATNLIRGKKLPLYGDGENVRDWLYVEDHCRAIDAVLRKGKDGEAYNIGGTYSCSNRELMEKICAALDRDPEEWIERVPDRPGHDRRYALDCSKIREQLGWEARKPFEDALRETVTWYRENRTWWETRDRTAA